ncbi:MAG TPA: hypothetical protein VFA86_13810 [Gammaproteobacteria bacterium]|nr:hypothetical protein [Gammaproteobacteria bacterium]
MKKKVKVQLKKPHTHAGRRYEAGDTIEVWDSQAEWLAGIGVAAAAGDPAPKKAAGGEDK